VVRSRSRQPLAYYFSADDYPAQALRDEAQGRTGFRLVVGPDGRVTGCTVTSSSGSEHLDAATCRIIRARARYYPARDAKGRPIVGFDSGGVTWRLPEEVEMPPPDVRLDFPNLPRGARAPVASVPLAYLFESAVYPDEIAGPMAPPPTGVSFIVGSGGGISGCTVTQSNGFHDLEAPVCRALIDGLRFEPARDASGRRIAVRAELSIVWQAPEANRTPEPPGISDNLASYFSQDDYPPAALRANEQGTVVFRLSVGADGRVFRCEVTRSSGSASLDEATCRILIVRARYTPARDREGRPTADIVPGRVTWTLPTG
jgi:TonB family protein